MGAITAAIGDAVFTSMWVFCTSTLEALTSVIASAIGVQGMAALFITTVLNFILLSVFSVIGDALGGANSNPTGMAAFYIAGIGHDSLYSMALRFPAQDFRRLDRIAYYAWRGDRGYRFASIPGY